MVVFNKVFDVLPLCVCDLTLVLKSTLSLLGIQGNLVSVCHNLLCYIGGIETSLFNPRTRSFLPLLTCSPGLMAMGRGWALQYPVSSQPAPVMATAQQCQEGPDSACLALSPSWPFFHHGLQLAIKNLFRCLVLAGTEVTVLCK